eukprot:CAMPEP_0174238096 /NCGR_PEP_ID=MMETSP0417-20130205/10196_1 /TAXON_ID=242541 /ORGANISM="Mayorella sp, Strain BSH-02190019" /LENGTH=415 /DNA_ID=CAMNT_0015316901 /DNA_START=76 /DNA_END=1320 /DNA_ORIENTATION=-
MAAVSTDEEAPIIVEVEELCSEQQSKIESVDASFITLNTTTTFEQRAIERRCGEFYRAFRAIPDYPSQVLLKRGIHVAYVEKGIGGLSAGYAALDASRPWLCYWILNSLTLLGASTDAHASRVISFLCDHCQHVDGGFCGGPAQLPHLAPSYAAVNALASLNDPRAYEKIDRDGMYRFLLRMKSPSGGFQMHDVGEVDVRATYCAIAVAWMLNLLTPELTAGVADYVARCQTYEGGFGGEPWNEAHGGYTFCGLAAAVLLDCTDRLNLDLLMEWLVNRQMPMEGGFQGRNNKLVDACYAFWQGAVFPLMHSLGFAVQDTSFEELNAEEVASKGGWLFNQERLQEYLIVCCQQGTSGGICDKPPKHPDFYHTCYGLAGISIAQHNPEGFSPSTSVWGDPSNLLAQLDPRVGVEISR